MRLSFVAPDSVITESDIRLLMFFGAAAIICYLIHSIGVDKYHRAAKKKFSGRVKFKGELSETDRKAQRVEERSFRLEEKAQEFADLSRKYESKAAEIAGDNGKLLAEIKHLEALADYISANANLTKEIEWLQRVPYIPSVNDIANVMTDVIQRQKMEAAIIKQACEEITSTSYHQPKSEAWLRSMSVLLQEAAQWMSTESARLRVLNVAATPAYGMRTR